MQGLLSPIWMRRGANWAARKYPGAVWAADFVNGQYYHSGRAQPLGNMVSDVRSTDIVLPDAHGILHPVGPAMPGRTSKGLGVYGGAAPLIAYSDDFSTWSIQNDASVNQGAAIGADGLMSAAEVFGGAGQSSSAIYFSLPSLTNKRVKASFRVKAGTADKLQFGIYQSGPGWFPQTSTILAGPGVVSGPALQLLEGLGDDWIEVEVTLDGPQTGAAIKVYFYPDGATLSTGKSVILDFAQATDNPAASIISPDLRTSGALVARAECKPLVVQGAGSGPFPGFQPASPEITFAVEWEGVPTAVGAAKFLAFLQNATNYGVNAGNQVALFMSAPSSNLTLGAYDSGSSFIGGASAGTALNDGGRHRAVCYVNTLTKTLKLAVDGGAPVTFISATTFASSNFGRVGLGFNKPGAMATSHANGEIGLAAAVSGDHFEAWR